MFKRILLTSLISLTAAGLLGNASAINPTNTLTPAGTVISNTGVFDYTDDNNTSQTVTSTPVSLTVSQVAALSIRPNGTVLAPGQTVYAAPGQTGMLTYTVQNDGNGNDSMVLSTLDALGNQLTGVTYFYDTARTLPVPTTGVPLTAGQSTTIYAFYTVASTAIGGDRIFIDPVGTSTFDTTKVDSDNYGVISSKNMHAVSLSGNNLGLTATTPGSATGTHTLTNTGNTPINPGDVTLALQQTDTNSILTGVSYLFSDGTYTGSPSSNLTTAFDSYLIDANGLAAGASVTLTTTYTTAALKTAAQTATTDATAYFTQVTTASDVYVTTTANATVAEDMVTIIAGHAVVTKVGDNCGTDVSCQAPVLNTTAGKPGDYIRYTIKVTNTGTSPLKKPIIHDVLNSYLKFISFTATTTQAGVNNKLVYSVDGAAFSITAPTVLDSSNTLYVGLNSTVNAAKPTTSDMLNNGESITVTLMTQLK